MQNKKIEIMSPVGSYESLMAAIQGGADSVYFGVGKLNMRSRSSVNFTLNDLDEIVKTAKEHAIRTYLTVNTIIYNNEIEEMKQVVLRAKSAGITAIIASDISVIDFAYRNGVEVHISTQCNVTNIDAVRFYSRFADVMVTARELSLKQVADIIDIINEEKIIGPSGKLVEIEVFAHGALCMAVSGKCYLSLDNKNYSANRGACLQMCRRSYIVTDKEDRHEYEIDHEYIMSPKDLCTIGFIDKIMKAGVRVLKIEGRGRSPEYVKTVTKCYKEASLAVLDGSYSKEKVDNWNEQLKTVFNRGFWDGYYLGRTMGEWSERYGSQSSKVKQHIGKVTNFFSNINIAELQIETDEIAVGDEVLIIGPSSGVVETTISEIRVNLKPVVKAIKGELCSVAVPEIVRRGDKLYKLVVAIDEY
ncbi:MAG: peptidase U32 family protein [Bacteroidota bacterium]